MKQLENVYSIMYTKYGNKYPDHTKARYQEREKRKSIEIEKIQYFD